MTADSRSLPALRLLRRRKMRAAPKYGVIILGPLAIGIVVAIVGHDWRLALATGSLAFTLSKFGVDELDSRSGTQARRVIWVATSPGPTSRSRYEGMCNVLPEEDGWVCERREPGVASTEEWQITQVRSAAKSGAEVVVVEDIYDSPDVTMALSAARRDGVFVIVVGSSRVDFPVGALGAGSFVTTGAAEGGQLMGTLMARALNDCPGSTALLVVKSWPAAYRPRAAYAALTLMCAGYADRTDLLEVEDSHVVHPLLERIQQLLQREGELVVGCMTDTQLVELAEVIRPLLSTADAQRLTLVGHDGRRDLDGRLYICRAPGSVKVRGTVDQRPALQGELVGRELINIAAGGAVTIRREASPQLCDLNGMQP